MKIGRNDPCFCGSGAKYKKCCISKNTDASSFYILDTYDPIEVIKLLSLLQLVPENHGKNIRIEEALSDSIFRYKSVKSKSTFIKVNSTQILNAINQKFPWDYREDPPENSFTDNIIFGGKNNVVFPGIVEEGPDVVQLLLDSIFRFKNELPEPFLKDVYEGVLFIFAIHEIICNELNFRRFEHKKRKKEELHFVPGIDANKFTLIQFTEEELKKICGNLNIRTEIISEFTLSVKEFIYNKEDINSNPLLYSPLLFIEEKEIYILAMPSAELIVINHYILKKAKELVCISDLIKIYKKKVYIDFLKRLNDLNFQQTNIGLIENDPFNEPFVSVLKFDSNKFAIACLIDNMGDGLAIKPGTVYFPEKDIAEKVKLIKSHDSNYEIHLLGIAFKIDVLTNFMFVDQKFKGVSHSTVFGILDLKVITTLWKCDQLSLWKYTKAKSRALEKKILSPGFKDFTLYSWYKSIGETFFHPEDNFDMLSFDFEHQGDLIRSTNERLDVHSVQMALDDRFIELRVYKKEEHFPFYALVSPLSDKSILLLNLYNVPIWISCQSEFKTLGDGFVGAIAYWLFEMYDSMMQYFKILGHLPLHILLDFDKRFLTEEITESNENTTLSYTLDPVLRNLTIQIPLNFQNDIISNKNNYSERILMGCLLKGIFNLVEVKTNLKNFTDWKIRSLVNSVLSNHHQRMIIPLLADSNILLNPTDTYGGRHLQESDISFINENILSWATISNLDHIKSKKDKTTFCNQMVALLIDKFREYVKDFECLSLLRMTMIRHESLIFHSTFSEESLSPKMNCFGKYQDVIEDFRKEVNKNVSSSLSYRCLIELIMAEPPSGTKIINLDDIDFLHALAEQIISFGNLSDVINEGFSETDITKLASGRIGLNHSFFDNELRLFSRSYLDNELSDKFNKNDNIGVTTNDKQYADKVNKVFKSEWGIGLFDLANICTILSNYAIFNLENSFVVLNEEDLFSILLETSSFTNEEISAFLKYMSLTSRGNINSLPPDSPFRKEEIYLWRYNRHLSYLRRPLLEIINNGEIVFAWSPRHLQMASNNLIALFYNGALKLDNTQKKIQSLLANRNDLNGKKFRKEVYSWLVSNTILKVIENEVPISPKSILKCKNDMGDIDIMAIDHKSKKVLLLELKNTKQAKNTYDFKRDIDTYLQKLIPKHSSRVSWLEQNKELLSQFLKFDTAKYELYSCIISSATLPLKYMDESTMIIHSFSELKAQGIKIFQKKYFYTNN